ncbi:hypothetical protein [uncultured Desulfobacter sp.]|uniref:hypothetical protein n=1 Tax=uncultured Desulfobacter sp. TaxID=240139 RepID=UPI002AAB42D8|nr:hypothetical protein [uncultured Desulfobacter sp.]
MNISHIQNACPYNSPNNTPRPHYSNGINSSNSNMDKVSLSAEGMKASEQDLEKFRMPSWISQYYPKQTDLTISTQAVEETRQLFQMHDHFNSDGHISRTEQQRLDSYRNTNMTANQTLRENLEFLSKYKDELAEYEKIVNTYYTVAKEEQGITQKNYNETVLQAEGDNESLHQSFRKKLLADSRALELMGILGIKLS